MKATYLYQKYNYQTGKVDIIRVPVQIVSETDKIYQVKLLAPNVNGHKWGDIIRVQRKSIDIPQFERQPKYDYSNAWWHN